MNLRSLALPLCLGTVLMQSCSPSSHPSTSTPTLAAEHGSQAILQNIQPGDLIRAAATGDEPRVRALLASGADVNETLAVTVPAHGDVPEHEESITPLLAAVANDDERIAKLLIHFQSDSHALFQSAFQGFSAKDFLLFRGQTATASLLRK